MAKFHLGLRPGGGSAGAQDVRKHVLARAGSPWLEFGQFLGSAPGRRRSADADLWRPCEPDVVRGPASARPGPERYYLLGLQGFSRKTRSSIPA